MVVVGGRSPCVPPGGNGAEPRLAGRIGDAPGHACRGALADGTGNRTLFDIARFFGWAPFRERPSAGPGSREDRRQSPASRKPG